MFIHLFYLIQFFSNITQNVKSPWWTISCTNIFEFQSVVKCFGFLENSQFHLCHSLLPFFIRDVGKLGPRKMVDTTCRVDHDTFIGLFHVIKEMTECLLSMDYQFSCKCDIQYIQRLFTLNDEYLISSNHVHVTF